MNDIQFGKYFDMQKDYELVESFELIAKKELDEHTQTLAYLFKSKLTGDYYAVAEDNYGSELEEAVEALVGNKNWTIIEIPPKSNDWVPDHYIGRVIFDPNL